MTMFKRDVSINALLYILDKFGGECDMHKSAKILYFSDGEHLSKYGKSITGDEYVAMAYGPVPSHMYDLEKAVRGDSYFSNYVDDIRDKYFYFKNDQTMVLIKRPDMDYLSESNVEILDKWIEELRDKSFSELVSISHGYAYSQTGKNNVIDVADILTEQGDSQDYIDYVKEKIQSNIAFV